MLIISLIILIICKALKFINNKLYYPFYLRFSAVTLIISSILTFNVIDLEGNLGLGKGIYGGLFQVTLTTQVIELLLFVVASLILVSWPNKALESSENLVTSSNYDLLTLSENSVASITENTNNHKGVEVIGEEENNTLKDSILKYNINYSILLIFSSLGASLFISTSDLISMYLCIELQSFSLYILSTLFKDLSLSTNAGLKYFLLGGLASCLILLGSGLIYSSLGLTNFESISLLISNQELNNIKDFELGITILIIGFLIKIAAAPLHNWSPDVYNSTPNIVTMWLTIIPKLSILIFLLELFSCLNLNNLGQELLVNSLSTSISNDISTLDLLIKSTWNSSIIKYLFLVVALISLIIGGIVGLNQKHIKRLLAYSTISHLGFILLSLSIYTEQSIESFIFYIIQYTLSNLNIFMIIIGLSYFTTINKSGNLFIEEKFYNKKFSDLTLISEFKGKFFYNPLLSICFSICFFSLAGIPPLIGFFSKQFILLSSIQEGYYFISIVGILVSVISASYYLKVIKELFYESENKEELNSNLMISSNQSINPLYLLSWSHSYIISILTLIILFFIFNPTLFLNTSIILALNIFPI